MSVPTVRPVDFDPEGDDGSVHAPSGATSPARGRLTGQDRLHMRLVQLRRPPDGEPPAANGEPRLPILLTVDEVANLLRTTRGAVYVMVERRQLPGTTRIGRRLLFRSADLLHWLDQKRTPSLQE